MLPSVPMATAFGALSVAAVARPPLPELPEAPVPANTVVDEVEAL